MSEFVEGLINRSKIPSTIYDRVSSLNVAVELKNRCLAAWVQEPARSERISQVLNEFSIANPLPEVRALSSWANGIVCLSRGEFNSALERLQEAQSGFEVIRDFLSAAQVRVAQVMPLAMLGKFDLAHEVGVKAMAELSLRGDSVGAAKVALNLGSLAMQRDRYGDAYAHYKKAAIAFAKLRDREHSVMADVGLADALSFSGNSSEAMRIYDRALMRADRAGLVSLAASATHGKALLQRAQGDMAKALSGIVSALQRYEKEEQEHFRSEVERDLADLYSDLKLIPEALTIYARLVAQLKSQGNEATRPWLLLEQSRAFALSEQFDAADQCLTDAHAIFQEQGNSEGLAIADLARLESYVRRVKLSSLKVDVNDFIQLADGLLSSTQESIVARATLAKGVLLILSNDAALGCELIGQLCAQNPPPLVHGRALAEMGVGFKALGLNDEATNAFEQSIQILESVRTTLPSEDLQMAAIDDQSLAYRERLAIALERENAPEVFAWLDQFRARLVNEHAGKRKFLPSWDAPTRSRVSNLRSRLSWIRLQQQRRTESGDDPLPQALLDEAKEHEEKLLEIVRAARITNFSTKSKNGSDPLNVHQFDSLPVVDEAIVEYGLLNGEVFAIVVVSGKVHLYRHLISATQLSSQIQKFDFQMQSLRSGREHLNKHLPMLLARCKSHAQSLYDKIWKPFAHHLNGAATVAVVPISLLIRFPFQALWDGFEWLGERHLMVQASNARRVLEQSISTFAPEPQQRASPSVRSLIIGNQSRLLHVEDEVNAIKAIAEFSTVLLNERADIETVLTNSRHADLIHIACHGEFRVDSPHYSALHLFDGPLTAARIEDCSIKAKLVALSACDTGLVQTSYGGESTGLVRAFLMAGAGQVMASRWAIEDKMTTNFMALFYAALRIGRYDAVAALASAQSQIRLIEPHPFFWASFAVYK
jgi:CHAT domain-containing protein